MERATEFVSYELARKYAHNLNLRSSKQWNKLTDLPKNIPKAPEAYYKKHGTWKNWSDFLNSDNRKNIEYIKFEHVKRFVRRFEIKNQREWFEFCKTGWKPHVIPVDLSEVYKNKGWKGWSDVFANPKTKKGGYMDFEKAKQFVKKLKLKNRDQFYDLKKRGLIPITIPRSPDKVYA